MNLILPPTPISPDIPIHPITPDSTSPLHFSAFNDDSTGLEEEDDLFPATAHAVERPSDPLLIPLPPSPTVGPVKTGLPHRRPKDWVSSLSSLPTEEHIEYDMRPEGTGQGKPRNVSARLPSGPSPLMLGGRTISGVMQYAMRPSGNDEAQSVGSPPALPPSRPTPDAILGEQDENAPGQIIPKTPGPDYHDEEEGEGYQVEGYGMAEIRDSVVGLTDQESDEIWMSYVRQQLGTLFPDFFHRDPSHADYDEMNDSFNPLPSPYDPIVVGQKREWGLVRDGAHHRPIEESTHLALQARNGMIGVPNVRQEISGLKEEIERLRGVVGGLASGMYERGVVRPAEQVGASAHGPTAREGNGAMADRLQNGFAHDVHKARESETKAAQSPTTADQHQPGFVGKDIPFEVTQQDVDDPAGLNLPAIRFTPDGHLSPRCLTAGYTEQEDEDAEAVEAEIGLEDTHPPDLPEAFFQTAHISFDIIQALAKAVQGRRNEKDKSTTPLSRDEVFREDSLLRLKRDILALLDP